MRQAPRIVVRFAPSPVMVALIQTATTLPIFLLVIPAGALADIIDRRRYLIAIQLWLAVVAALLGFLTLAGITTAWILIVMTFAMGLGSAMMMPAWAALTPELVPRNELQSTIALNSLGMNVARATGPALAGTIVSLFGAGAVFVLNALSYTGIIWVLARWQREALPSELPSERFFGAMRTGFRFVRHAPELQAAVMRGFGFFLFTSASWALLPLIAKSLVNGGPQGFGILVGSVGAGAVGGALVLPTLRARLSADLLVATATLLYATAMVGLASMDRLAILSLVMALSGVAWITVLSSLQVAAQMALPDWVRSRGLAVFMAIVMGSMALGSLLWGKMAELFGVPHALEVAAIGAVAAVVVTWRWRISGFEKANLTPSMHWPTPVTRSDVTADRGPVLVTIQYDVQSQERIRFLRALRTLGKRRRRDGAFAWSIFEHTELPDHFIETFSVESWLEHLRQHQRVTDADKVLQASIQDLLVAGSSPLVTHYVAPDARALQEQE